MQFADSILMAYAFAIALFALVFFINKIFVEYRLASVIEKNNDLERQIQELQTATRYLISEFERVVKENEQLRKNVEQLNLELEKFYTVFQEIKE